MKLNLTGVCTLLFCCAAAPPAGATPDLGITENNNCSACHQRILSNRLRVTEEDFLTDLGMRPQKTYLTAPGETVRLSATVLMGSDRFALQLKNLDSGGLQNDPDHLLFWSEANDPNNLWTRRQGTAPPYFTKDDGRDGGIPNEVTPITYHFDLHLDPNTPLDLYELVFALAGRSQILGKWYQEERFYIAVACPFELVGDLNHDCQVDNADFALMAENWLVNCIHDRGNPACLE